jgi:putative transposase
VDGRGVPLSLIVTGANRHDVSQLGPVLDALVMEPLKSLVGSFIYGDRGYDGEPARETIIAHGSTPRVRRKKRKLGRPPKNRRWIVEAAHSWYNRFRKLLVRFEKFTESYEALLHLASAIICWRKVAPIYG